MRCADLTRAANLAYRVLLERGVDALPVDPLALLKACRQLSVLTFEQAAEGLDLSAEEFVRRFGDSEAFVLRDDQGRSVLVYRADGNPARLRFTLAHELGHIVLGHCGSTRADEQEADCFANHLLCPRPVLEAALRSDQSFTPEKAARLFYVSAACARTVLREARGFASPDLFEAVAQRFGVHSNPNDLL